MSSTAPSSRAGRADREALARWPTRPLSRAAPPAVSRPFVATHRTPPRALVRRGESRIHGGVLPVLVALFAVLNAADLASTFIGLASGMHEGNPLMGALLSSYGFGALILYKIMVIVAVGAGVVFLRFFHRRVAHITIWVCNLLVLGVVVSNLMQFVAGR